MLDLNELVCLKCGSCCTYKGVPCEELQKDGDKYICKIYGRHHGKRKTIIGDVFNCGTIHEAIKIGFSYKDCAYVRGNL